MHASPRTVRPGGGAFFPPLRPNNSLPVVCSGFHLEDLENVSKSESRLLRRAVWQLLKHPKPVPMQHRGPHPASAPRRSGSRVSGGHLLASSRRPNSPRGPRPRGRHGGLGTSLQAVRTGIAQGAGPAPCVPPGVVLSDRGQVPKDSRLPQGPCEGRQAESIGISPRCGDGVMPTELGEPGPRLEVPAGGAPCADRGSLHCPGCRQDSVSCPRGPPGCLPRAPPSPKPASRLSPPVGVSVSSAVAPDPHVRDPCSSQAAPVVS